MKMVWNPVDRCQSAWYVLALILNLFVSSVQNTPAYSYPNQPRRTSSNQKDGCDLPNQRQNAFGRYLQRKKELRVGVIYTEDDFADGFRKQAFEAASRLINQGSSDYCLVLHDIIVQNLSSFHLSKSVCEGLESHAYHALMGPNSVELSPHARSICNAIDVPYLEMTPDTSSRLISRDSAQFSLNVHPKLEDIHDAFRDFLVFANWTRVAIVFIEETSKRSILLQDFLLSQGFECLALRITLDLENEVVQVLKQKDYHNILIDITHADIHLPKFFQVCHQVGLYGEGRNFFLIALEFNEMTTANPEQIVNKHFNRVYPHWKSFSFFRLQNRDHPQAMDLAQALKTIQMHRRLHMARQYLIIDEPTELVQNRKQSDEEAIPYPTNVEQSPPDWSDESMILQFPSNQTDNSSRNVYQSTEANPPTLWFHGMRMAAKMQHDTGSHVEYEPAIIYDSLLVLMNTVKALNYHYAPLLLTPQQLVPEHNGDPLGRKRGSASSPSPTSSVSCRSEKPWEYGPTFYNYLNAAQTEGMTGQLAFKGGRRSSLSLELMRYSRPTATVNKIGHWSRTGGLSVLNESLIESNDQEEVILRVVTRQEKPYVMINKLLKGNDAFDGFAIDLLKAISDVVGFKFRLYIVPDNLYGVYNHETGEWNGIVRQLTDKRADLAVASMTINYARETVIDFTKPFMNLGISILFKAPKDPATELFSFMNPLALEIWLYMLIAYILVSITIWIVARFSPYEWAHPHPCVDTGLVFQNDFTLPNSFWFAIGTLMQQGSDLNPKAASTRIVGGIWWFFTLIIISSYTANLAAFLTVERMATPIESAEDLADQSDIKYGTLRGGSTMTFFRDSKMETYQKMWRYMESNDPDTFVNSYEEGVERVLKGNYAFLCESTMLDYLIQRNCNLTQIGGLLDNKGYGIATPIGSKWKDKISQAVLYLQEKGVIQMYYDKWWKNHGHQPGMLCSQKKKLNDQAQANALGVVNIGGIFVVLLCGLAFAVIVAIMEFCWRTKHRRKPHPDGNGEPSTLAKSRSTNDISSSAALGPGGHGQSLCSEMLHNLAPFLFGMNSRRSSRQVNEENQEDQYSASQMDRRYSQDLQYMQRSKLTTCSLIKEQSNL